MSRHHDFPLTFYNSVHCYQTRSLVRRINERCRDDSLVDKLKIPQGIRLEEFLTKELQASSLTVKPISKNEISIESDSIVRIHILINEKSKQVKFDLFSPRWSRRITVQQLDGFEFMEWQAEDQLLKENAGAIAEDSLLALDIIRFWASKNGYEASEVPPSSEDNPN